MPASLTAPELPATASRPAWPRCPPPARDGHAKMVGILNLTPDSFYDGGRHDSLAAAIRQAELLAAEGAAIIDIGGESTRPGYAEVSVTEEIARVVPVIAALAGRLNLPLSIDTSKPAVARAALAAGADIINDVRGFHGDPVLAEVAAQHGCGVILMHQEAAFSTQAGATMERLADFLHRALERALASGVRRERIILDPGIGFAKTPAQNLEIMARIGELRSLGCPLLLGASRKSIIGRVLSQNAEVLLPPEDRFEGTLATTALAVWQGVEFLRVHDVCANLRVARMVEAMREAGRHA